MTFSVESGEDMSTSAGYRPFQSMRTTSWQHPSQSAVNLNSAKRRCIATCNAGGLFCYSALAHCSLLGSPHQPLSSANAKDCSWPAPVIDRDDADRSLCAQNRVLGHHRQRTAGDRPDGEGYRGALSGRWSRSDRSLTHLRHLGRSFSRLSSLLKSRIRHARGGLIAQPTH
jgi:hypothetical protein